MSYKVYSLSTIKQAIIDLGWCSDQMATFALEQALEDAKKKRGSWRKRPVKWFNLEFDSKRQCADYLKISEHTLFHIMKDDRTFQGSKIEYI